jgi:hypothetical protein
MTTTLLTLATDPTALATILLTCLLVIALSVRSLRRSTREDGRVDAFLESIRLSGYAWDAPTGWTGLSDRTDTAAFPAIVLAGTVAG